MWRNLVRYISACDYSNKFLHLTEVFSNIFISISMGARVAKCPPSSDHLCITVWAQFQMISLKISLSDNASVNESKDTKSKSLRRGLKSLIVAALKPIKARKKQGKYAKQACNLPAELWELIILQSSVSDLENLYMVSKQLQVIISRSSLLAQYFLKHFKRCEAIHQASRHPKFFTTQLLDVYVFHCSRLS